MITEILPTPEAVAREGAARIAAHAGPAIVERGKFVLAVSGGTTPWVMLRELAGMELPWGQIHILQVDERIAPDGHPDRNWTHIKESLGGPPLPTDNLHPMPVTDADLEAAAARYASALHVLLGPDGALDLCHLGLGPDGHTASLVPGDSVLNVTDRDVALTGNYQGRRRMTLTYPILNRARAVLWLVTGESKQNSLKRLQERDASIPAGRVEQVRAILLADRAAVGTP